MTGLVRKQQESSRELLWNLQQVILRIFSGNFTMFGVGFRAGLLDEDSFLANTATNSSLDLFRHKTFLLGTGRPSIGAIFRWLEFVFVQQMDVGLYYYVSASSLHTDFVDLRGKAAFQSHDARSCGSYERAGPMTEGKGNRASQMLLTFVPWRL